MLKPRNQENGALHRRAENHLVYRSEGVSDRDLHFSWIARQTPPVFADGQRVDYAEIAVVVSIGARFVIVDGVCKILHLQPRLQFLSFGDAELLCNRHAQVLVTGQPEEVAADVAELARRRSGELRDLFRSDVGEQSGTGIAMDVEHVWLADIAVGNRAYDTAECVVTAGGKYGRGAPTLDYAKPADLPSAQSSVDKAVPAMSPALAVSEGKLIDPDALEHVGTVEVGRRVVQPAMIQVKWRAGSSKWAGSRSHGGESWI